jgi:hypothetical protein
MALAPAPLFTHDCDCCRFLGSVNDARREQFVDLYVCRGSVIARFGHDGPEYTSIPTDMAQSRPTSDTLRIAASLAAGA